MRKSVLLLFASLFVVFPTMAQEKSVPNSFPKLEFALIFGRNSPVGYFGMEAAYRPAFLRRTFQGTVSIGFAWPEGVKFSGGVNIFPLADHRLAPFAGTSFTFAAGAWYPSENGTESITLGQHKYLNPYVGLQLYDKKRIMFVKLVFGYSILIGNPNIVIAQGQTNSGINWYGYYSRKVISEYFVAFGFGANLK
mgnify:CR=1 FL=1